MKKLMLTILLTVSLTQAAIFAAEETQKAEQKTDDNIAAISVQKQPLNENSKQKITKNIACIIIQVNGKVLEQKQLKKK